MAYEYKPRMNNPDFSESGLAEISAAAQAGLDTAITQGVNETNIRTSVINQQATLAKLPSEIKQAEENVRTTFLANSKELAMAPIEVRQLAIEKENDEMKLAKEKIRFENGTIAAELAAAALNTKLKKQEVDATNHLLNYPINVNGKQMTALEFLNAFNNDPLNEKYAFHPDFENIVGPLAQAANPQFRELAQQATNNQRKLADIGRAELAEEVAAAQESAQKNNTTTGEAYIAINNAMFYNEDGSVRTDMNYKESIMFNQLKKYEREVKAQDTLRINKYRDDAKVKFPNNIQEQNAYVERKKLEYDLIQKQNVSQDKIELSNFNLEVVSDRAEDLYNSYIKSDDFVKASNNMKDLNVESGVMYSKTLETLYMIHVGEQLFKDDDSKKSIVQLQQEAGDADLDGEAGTLKDVYAMYFNQMPADERKVYQNLFRLNQNSDNIGRLRSEISKYQDEAITLNRIREQSKALDMDAWNAENVRLNNDYNNRTGVFKGLTGKALEQKRQEVVDQQNAKMFGSGNFFAGMDLTNTQHSQMGWWGWIFTEENHGGQYYVNSETREVFQDPSMAGDKYIKISGQEMHEESFVTVTETELGVPKFNLIYTKGRYVTDPDGNVVHDKGNYNLLIGGNQKIADNIVANGVKQEVETRLEGLRRINLNVLSSSEQADLRKDILILDEFLREINNPKTHNINKNVQEEVEALKSAYKIAYKTMGGLAHDSSAGIEALVSLKGMLDNYYSMNADKKSHLNNKILQSNKLITMLSKRNEHLMNQFKYLQSEGVPINKGASGSAGDGNIYKAPTSAANIDLQVPTQ